MHYRYVLVGGGFAAAAAIEGIRSRDRDGSILLVSRENHLPYQRPSLSKDLWTGEITLDRLPLHPDTWYAEQRVDLALRREIVELDADTRVLWDDRGQTIGYDELLLATGTRPRRLKAEGSESRAVRYFRDLEDYLELEGRFDRFQHATCVGGGFLAVELATALRQRGKEITLVFPDEYPLHRFLPRELGMGIVELLRDRGIETVSNETLVSIREDQGYVHARTFRGDDLTTQVILVDTGAEPASDLAEAAGLDTDDGIVVDEYGRGSKPHVWAAGDVAEFPYLALGQLMRVEGVDHAQHHGRVVGANMAGANQAYGHLPLKWFRLFDIRFEGVGDIHARLGTEVVWIEPGVEGVVYYLWEDVVRGILLVNVPSRVEWARGVIRDGKPTTATERAAMTMAGA